MVIVRAGIGRNPLKAKYRVEFKKLFLAEDTGRWCSDKSISLSSEWV